MNPQDFFVALMRILFISTIVGNLVLMVLGELDVKMKQKGQGEER